MNDILGTLGAADGAGVVRIEKRLGAPADEVWAALTQPARLARWYGEIEGELRAGGVYRASLHASGWEGTGRIEVCDAPRQLMVMSEGSTEGAHSTEVTLTENGHETVVVVEQRGLPLDLVWAYGVGLQIHVEDLAAHLSGRARVDAKTRFDELRPAYADLAAAIR